MGEQLLPGLLGLLHLDLTTADVAEGYKLLPKRTSS